MAILKVDTVSGIGTEGTVFEGDITFDSLNYMTLPKGTTAQRGRGRGLFAGGFWPSTARREIQHVTIATTGDALDFGDCIVKHEQAGSVSNAHGGLG